LQVAPSLSRQALLSRLLRQLHDEALEQRLGVAMDLVRFRRLAQHALVALLAAELPAGPFSALS
jgi:hypothetical protein